MGLMWEGGDKPRTPQFGFYCWNLERSQAWRGRGDPAAEPQGNFSALFSKSDAFCETSSHKRLAWQGQPGGGLFFWGGASWDWGFCSIRGQVPRAQGQRRCPVALPKQFAGK